MKKFPLEVVRDALEELGNVIGDNTTTLARAKQDNIIAAYVETLEAYNLLRSMSRFKTQIAPLFEEFGETKVDLAKPLLDPEESPHIWRYPDE